MNYFGLYDKLMFFFQHSIAQFVISCLYDIKDLIMGIILFIVYINFKYFSCMYKLLNIIFDLMLSELKNVYVFCTQK